MALVFDIERCKLSQLALPAINEVGRSTSRRYLPASGRVQGFRRFHIRGLHCTSGSTCAVPWEKSFSLNLQIFMLGEMKQ